MLVRTLGVIVALVWQVALAQAQADNTPPLLPGTSALSGQVIDARSTTPIQGATVMLSSFEARAAGTMRTSANGSFAFDKIAAGTYGLYIRADGYADVRFGAATPFAPGAGIAVAADQRLTGVVIKLQPGGIIRGRVLDESGQPLPIVRVSAGTASTRTPGRFVGVQTSPRADEHGRYEITNLPAGDWIINVIGSGMRIGSRPGEVPTYAPTFYPGVTDLESAKTVHVDAGETIENIDVTVRSVVAHTLRLPVSLPDDTDPATVEIVLASSVLTGTAKHTARSLSPDGQLVLPGVKPGDYLVWARAKTPGGTHTAMRDITIKGDTTEPPLTFSPAGSIAGRIVGEDGSPAMPAGMRVSAALLRKPAERPLPLPDSTDAAPDGSFLLGGMFGHRQLNVSMPQGWKLRHIVLAGEKIPAEAVLEVQPGQAIRDVILVVGRAP